MPDWKQTLANCLMDVFRLSIRICIFVDGILLALFSLWFCGKFLWQTIGWLNRVLFSNPW